MLKKILKKTEASIIHTALGASIFIIVLASYLYLFKIPLSEFIKLQKSRRIFNEKVDNGKKFSGDIKKLKKKVVSLKKQLHGEIQVEHEREILADIIDSLDDISTEHDIQLLSVRPGIPNNIPMFKEIPFHVEVSGRYLRLYQWLRDVERQFGSMVVKRFDLQRQKESDNLRMTIKMVSYRPSQEIK